MKDMPKINTFYLGDIVRLEYNHMDRGHVVERGIVIYKDDDYDYWVLNEDGRMIQLSPDEITLLQVRGHDELDLSKLLHELKVIEI